MKSNACLLLAVLTFTLTACIKANLPAERTLADTVEPTAPEGTSRVHSQPAPEPASSGKFTESDELPGSGESISLTDAHRPSEPYMPPVPDGLTEAPEDDPAPDTGPQLIWQRIARNLEFSQMYDQPPVVRFIQSYLKREQTLYIMSHRAEPFIHFIVSEVERRNMPAELAILPMVESGYQPRAVSRARAAGLWQFIYRTARQYDLERTCCYDGRYDVHASTMAALDHLSDLHAELEGNWIYALMAYNAGLNRVQVALKHNAMKSTPGGYWDLKLPRETREYVPRLLALSAIVHDPNLSTTLLHPIADTPQVEVLETDKRISPAKLVKHAEINRAEFLTLNPALQLLDYPIPAGHRLLVPKHKAELIASTIDSLPEEKLQKRYRHSIRYGESLSVIAARYGTSVAALRKANSLNGDTIRAGKTLMIPPGTWTPATSHNLHRHIIRHGESLSVIAARFGTSVAALRKANSLNGDTIRAGKTLKIPFAAWQPAASSHPHRHTITLGESLSVIAARYGTSVAALRKANSLNGDTIRAGKTLKIPFAAWQPAASSHPHRHTITLGESLSVIAARYGTSVAALRKANSLNGDTIRAGKTLKIPSRQQAL